MSYAILLCAVASLATGAGGVIVALWPRMSPKVLAFFQGFAAGVMIGISFLNMLPNSFADLSNRSGNMQAAGALLGLFTLGWALSLLLAHMVVPCGYADDMAHIKSVCIITTMIIVMHNLPEGMLTAFSGYSDRQLGADMALAVALHNIPEGIAVASSVVCVTSSKLKGIFHSFAAGMAELVGGVVALLILHRFITPQLLNMVLAVISGVMVQVSLCQLIPGGAKLCSVYVALMGVIAGVATISLGIFII